MSDLLDSPDPQRSRLRALVADVERELGNLETNADQAPATPLRSAWSTLVKGLLLGPEPELRSCPTCARAIILEATRCRYCWQRSAAAALPAAP